MVARIQRSSQRLLVHFSRMGFPIQTVLCADGAMAFEHASHLIASAGPELRDGDMLLITSDLDLPADLPALNLHGGST